ncbi:MAG: type IV toxin-antitoxin system AbiEi family antitoxin domain-containing protein [Nitrospirota bacterium]
MKTIELIKSLERFNKPSYSIADIEKITGLSRKSLYVVVKRLVDRGIFEKIGRGIYCPFTAKASVEKIAASLYIPNYLSFEFALSRYGVLNLVPYTLTFATTRKTKRLTLEGRDIEFRQIKKDLFWGYEMQGGIYVAKPEKAFLDLVYLASRGMASLDLDELNIKKLSMATLKKLSKRFPMYTQKYLDRLISS